MFTKNFEKIAAPHKVSLRNLLARNQQHVRMGLEAAKQVDPRKTSLRNLLARYKITPKHKPRTK